MSLMVVIGRVGLRVSSGKLPLHGSASIKVQKITTPLHNVNAKTELVFVDAVK